MDYERAVLFCKRQGHKKTRDELRSVLAGNFGTAGLERSFYCQWDTDNGRRFLDFARNDIGVVPNDIRFEWNYIRFESIHYLFGSGERTSQKGLLSCK